MQAKYELRVQAIRSKGQQARLYVYFPLPLAAAIGMEAGETVQWELLSRRELHGSVAEFVGEKRERRSWDFDRRAARAKAEKPPLCSLNVAGGRFGFAIALKRQEVVGHC
jgi:hypothetical protein